MVGEEFFKYKLMAFTLSEVMVTLALTSLCIVFAYGSLNYVQKLFVNYRAQNQFLNEYISLKTRLDHEALNAEYILEENENSFKVKRDSIELEIEIRQDKVLMKHSNKCDTFHLAAKNIKKEYEMFGQGIHELRLIKKLSFDVKFSDQIFDYILIKSNDSAVKLKLVKNGKY
jgi:hypothetical protein